MPGSSSSALTLQVPSQLKHAAGTVGTRSAQAQLHASQLPPLLKAVTPSQEAVAPGAAVTHLLSCVVANRSVNRPVMFRAKAGGRQSSKDASGKHAQSGGAALRRYNEVQPCEC